MNPKLEIRDTGTYGRGVFAKEALKKGETLFVMGGYICDIGQENQGGEFCANYNMDISVTHSFSPITESDLDLMPQHLVNHSCEPNAGFSDTVTMVAIKDIDDGQEIRYDYAFVMWSSPESEVHYELRCGCGTPSCRGLIREDDWMIRSLQEKYGAYFQPFLRTLFEDKR